MSDLEHDAYVYPGRRIARSGAVLGHGQGMSLRDWFAGQASEPSADWMQLMRDMDRNSNPHNDPHKPRQRSDFELTAVWKYEHADAMLAARKGGDK